MLKSACSYMYTYMHVTFHQSGSYIRFSPICTLVYVHIYACRFSSIWFIYTCCSHQSGFSYMKRWAGIIVCLLGFFSFVLLDKSLSLMSKGFGLDLLKLVTVFWAHSMLIRVLHCCFLGDSWSLGSFCSRKLLQLPHSVLHM